MIKTASYIKDNFLTLATVGLLAGAFAHNPAPTAINYQTGQISIPGIQKIKGEIGQTVSKAKSYAGVTARGSAPYTVNHGPIFLK